jgi:hypothetical protein
VIIGRVERSSKFGDFKKKYFVGRGIKKALSVWKGLGEEGKTCC